MVLICTGVILLALGQCVGLLWTLQGREEWQISPNEFVWRARILGFSWEKRYQNGTLQLRRVFWGHGSAVEYRLYIRASGRRSRSLYTTFKWPAMNQLTCYLAAQLGWPIDQGWK